MLLCCDEVLGGLDAIRQPRVLRMLKQLQEELQLGILYITTELLGQCNRVGGWGVDKVKVEG